MGLLDSGPTPCKLARIRDELDDAFREEFDATVDHLRTASRIPGNNSGGAATLARRLTEHGHRISKDAARYHILGICCCGPT